MGGRWNTRDPWDDADPDDAADDDWNDDWSSSRSGSGSGGGGAYQRRPYQPDRSQAQPYRPDQSQARPYQSPYQAPYQSQRRPAYPPYDQSQARASQPYRSQQQYQPYQQSQQYQPYASSSRAGVATRTQGSQPKRKSGTAIFGGLLSLVAAVALVGLLAHNQILALLHRGGSPTATSALVVPAFSDWRVAYAGQDGLLHAVSLDGQTDVTGISLPALTAATPTAGGSSAQLGAATSPDGHYLIYTGAGGPVLLHLTAHQGDQDASRTGATVPSSLLWSPDGTQLAWLASNGAVHLTNVATLADTATSGTATLGIRELLGWTDATHLAVRVDQTNSSTEQVAVLDTASGQLRVVVSLTKPGYGALHYSLSPDGARLFAYNTAINGQFFTAIFRNYDMSNGQVRKLPNALRAIGMNVSAVTWKPGTQMVAISGGSEATHDLKLWLVDASGDTATSIGAAYPLGWLSDGSQLIGGNANAATLGGGPYTISAFSFPATGAPTVVTLTDKAMSFPWLGLVHTA